MSWLAWEQEARAPFHRRHQEAWPGLVWELEACQVLVELQFQAEERRWEAVPVALEPYWLLWLG